MIAPRRKTNNGFQRQRSTAFGSSHSPLQRLVLAYFLKLSGEAAYLGDKFEIPTHFANII